MDDAVGWLVALSFAFFTFRYFFGSSSSSGSGSGTRRYAVPSSSIETVSSMFPHIPTASIRYELERTRNNVEATVERCLRDGRLPDPPAGFFVDPLTSNAPTTPRRPAAAAAAPVTPSSASTSGTSSPSLIARLNLQDRVASQSPEPPMAAAGVDGKGKGKVAAPAWEGSAEARERSLRERKEKMVLEARRKLLEKEQAKKASAV